MEVTDWGHEHAVTFNTTAFNQKKKKKLSSQALTEKLHRASLLFLRLAACRGYLAICAARGRLTSGIGSVVFQNDIPSDPDTYSRKSAVTLSKEHT